MNTIYQLSSSFCIDGLFDDFALDDEDLRQIALDNYEPNGDGEVQVEVRPSDKPDVVRIREGGRVRAIYHIFQESRVSR